MCLFVRLCYGMRRGVRSIPGLRRRHGDVISDARARAAREMIAHSPPLHCIMRWFVYFCCSFVMFVIFCILFVIFYMFCIFVIFGIFVIYGI